MASRRKGLRRVLVVVARSFSFAHFSLFRKFFFAFTSLSPSDV